MIWILAVVVIGMIAVLAELLLTYQKRAQDLRFKQDPIRSGIRGHAQAMQEAVGGIQESAAGQVQELTGDLRTLAGGGEELRSQLTQLEHAVFGEAHDPNAPQEEKDELIEQDDPAAKRIDDEETPEDLLREAHDFHRQEVDGHRLSLQRDIEIVRRTLTQLEAKLRRGTTKGQQKTK